MKASHRLENYRRLIIGTLLHKYPKNFFMFAAKLLTPSYESENMYFGHACCCTAYRTKNSTLKKVFAK
jgi:hypothetical protein